MVAQFQMANFRVPNAFLFFSATERETGQGIPGKGDRARETGQGRPGKGDRRRMLREKWGGGIDAKLYTEV